MFIVHLYVEVNGSDWTKEILLPFVPMQGLRIGDIIYTRDPHEIDEVVWSLDRQLFDVWCDPEQWDCTEEELEKEMRERGWCHA